MKRNEMEGKIKRAYELATPDIKDTVLFGATNEAVKDISVIPVKTKKSKIFRTAISLAATAAVIGIVILGGVYYTSNYITDTVVSLDVNPSIEIKLAKNEKVLSVESKNADGMLIIGDMDLKGTNIDVTVNALVGSMVRNGYISDLANSVLISVEGGDERTENEIKTKITTAVEKLLDERSITGAIVSQTVDTNNDIKALADKNSITVGKAQLISKIVSTSDVYKFEELAHLSINELNLISKNTQKLENVEIKGEASDKSYIGEKNAAEIALKHLGVTSSDVSKIKTEFDYEDGMMIYEVEFSYSDKRYEYEIDAVTGEIIDIETDKNGNEEHKHEHRPPKDENGNISHERAKEIVFIHAGVGIEGVQNLEIELEHDDGVKKYEIEFSANGIEYEYEINAVTGTIIKFEADKNEDPDITVSIISKEEAKTKALEHSKADPSKVRFEKIELETDEGRVSYEVEFTVNGIEYEYDIDAYSGEIMDFKTDHEKN